MQKSSKRKINYLSANHDIPNSLGRFEICLSRANRNYRACMTGKYYI